MDQKEYEQLKRSVSGYYSKFNTQVLKWYMNKIFDYTYLLESANEFKTFEEYYNFHTKNKGEVISSYVEEMLKEAESKVPGTTRGLIETCIKVRLGNIYTGMVIETKIIDSFNNLNDWISCTKTEKEIDMNYKVDAIVQVAGISEIAIQIKPISFTHYGLGTELTYHQQFEKEFGTKVFYVFYKDLNNILFNGNNVELNDVEKIVQILENLIYSN